jgi:hypothetical protein
MEAIGKALLGMERAAKTLAALSDKVKGGGLNVPGLGYFHAIQQPDGTYTVGEGIVEKTGEGDIS